MKNQQHVGIWLALIIMGFFLSPLMRSGDRMEAFVIEEIRVTREALGETVSSKIVGFAAGMYSNTPLSVVATAASSAKHSQEEIKLSKTVAGIGGEAMSRMFNSYLEGLVLQSYVAAMRLAISLIWIAVLAPLLGAAIYDGFMQRSIKRMEFGAIRPATFTFAGLIVIPLMFLPLVYLVLPFNVSPLVAPAWGFIVALPLSILVSNMQPIFGR